MLPWILLAVAGAVIAGLVFAVARLLHRLWQYDEVLQYMSDDIQINLGHFARMMTSNIMSNEPEIQKAHQNMVTMARRLNEILLRMEEVSGLNFRPLPPPERPKVV